jgi:GNAT superfamily N-acetyltransferase
MSEDLLGRRVVLRRHAGERDGRPAYADILGELIDARDGTLVIRKADGEVVTVPVTEVHRLRPVPPGRAEIFALEEVAAQGWPAPETARLGDWLLRAGEGWTRRANSALLLGDPGMSLPQAFQHVVDWYAGRDLVPRLVVPLPSMAAADHAAERLGWTFDVDVDVLAAPVSTAPPDSDVQLASTPDAGWMAAYRARTVPPVGLRILTVPATVTFASLIDGDTTVAIGRGVVIGDWLGIAAMEVLPEHRRRGLGRRVLRALLAWGAGQGATRCYLQVETTNPGAMALYAGAGFTRHHRCRNRYSHPVDRTEHRGERDVS